MAEVKERAPADVERLVDTIRELNTKQHAVKLENAKSLILSLLKNEIDAGKQYAYCLVQLEGPTRVALSRLEMDLIEYFAQLNVQCERVTEPKRVVKENRWLCWFEVTIL